MGYQNDGREPSKGKLAAIGGVLVVLLAGGIANVVGRTAAREGVDAYQRHDAISKIDSLEQEGPMAGFLQELRRADPAKADAIMAEMKEAIRMASSPGEANRRMFEYSRTAMAEFRATAPQASEVTLRQLAESRLALLEVMRSDSDLSCARMAATGPWPNMVQTPAITAALSRASQMTIRAGAEGMRNPIQRPQPSDEEWGRMGDRLFEAGVAENELAALGEGKIGSLSPSRQCNLYIRFYEQSIAARGREAANMLAAGATE